MQNVDKNKLPGPGGLDGRPPDGPPDGGPPEGGPEVASPVGGGPDPGPYCLGAAAKRKNGI